MWLCVEATDLWVCDVQNLLSPSLSQLITICTSGACKSCWAALPSGFTANQVLCTPVLSPAHEYNTGFVALQGCPAARLRANTNPADWKRKEELTTAPKGKRCVLKCGTDTRGFFGSIDAICLMSRKGSCCKAGMSSGNAGQSLLPSQAALSVVALVLTYLRFSSMPIQPACFFLTMKNVCCLQSNTQLWNIFHATQVSLPSNPSSTFSCISEARNNLLRSSVAIFHKTFVCRPVLSLASFVWFWLEIVLLKRHQGWH